jgi:chromosome partitioning protein
VKSHGFVDNPGLPVVGYLRDTQSHIHLAARDLSVFEMAPSRVAKDMQRWQATSDWREK